MRNINHFEIVTDDPGRYLNKFGGGQRSSWAPANPPDIVEEQRFAHRLAEQLQTALAQRLYESLAILAPAGALDIAGALDNVLLRIQHA